MISKVFGRIFDFFASLQLAVGLILTLAVVLGTGTVYESKYGAHVAAQLVYRSWWMQVLLWVFILNVAAAAISRLPWKKQHVGFLITHLGIIILLMGGWVQQRRGVDGILALAPGESGRMVRMDEAALYVFRTEPGKNYELVVDETLDFDLRYPSSKVRTFDLAGEEKQIKILNFYPKATRNVEAESMPKGKGVPALKFTLSGSRATFSDWMFLQNEKGTTNELGPAVLRFVKDKPDLSKAPEKPTMYFYLEGNAELSPKVAVARAGEKFRELGRIPTNKTTPLGWMDFELTLGDYRPAAIPRASYSPMEKPIPGFDGYQVVEAELAGQKLWLELGASGQISAGNYLYYVQYARRQVDLKFDVALKSFKIDYYEGTVRPKEYSSVVEVAGQEHLISMNEPLKHGGFTFYQASYEMDEATNKPKASVFSVNYDPGRAIKYFGSLMMCLGIISMFYFKPKYSGTTKALMRRKENEE
ncbi:MAG: hypothetical protein EOP11_15515 [Proteobacteria bacterium]|nr:MAG: hypothetical protein EOP11_15515 [Pseudomonadota bacterium]